MEPRNDHYRAHRLTGSVGEPITAAIIVSAIFSAASFGISMLAGALLGKKTQPRGPFDDKPTTLTQRGTMIPLLFGRRRIGYVMAWAGQRSSADTDRGRVYFEAGWHQLCVGPAYALHGIYENGKPIFTRTITRSDTPSGSVLTCTDRSSFTIYWGECNQPVNTYLAQGGTDKRGKPLYPGVLSRWPNLCYVVWNKKRLGYAAQWPTLTYELESRIDPIAPALTRSAAYIPMSQAPNPSATIPGGGAVVLIGAVPEGTYTLSYVGGALRYSSKPNDWRLHANDRARNSWRIVNARGATVTNCPGNGVLRGSQAEVEASNAGASKSFYWSGGNLYLRLVDSNLKDNQDGAPNPTFRLSGPGGTFTVAGAVRAGMSGAGSADDGANPAHVLWQLLTARFPHGLGLTTDMLDGESFEQLGELCASERLAVNFVTDGAQDSRQIITNLMADVSLLLPQVGDRITAKPVRPATGGVPTVTADHSADGPASVRVLHGSLMADRTTFYIRNRLRGYRADDNIGDGDFDRQAARNGRPQARQVELTTVTDRITGAAVSRRRSLESTTDSTVLTMTGLRDTSTLTPGDAFVIGGLGQYRLASIKRGLLSPTNAIKASLDQYGRQPEGTAIDSRDDDVADAGLPEVDPLAAAVVLPDPLRPIAAGRWVGVFRIREDVTVDGATAHISADDANFTQLGEVPHCTGGTLNSPLPVTLPDEIAIGPSITVSGPDISQAIDLTGRDAEYLAGVQLALIGAEVFLLRRVTAVSGGYRLEGLKRAMYGTVAQDHPDNSPVFIFTRSTMGAFNSPLALPGSTPLIRIVPRSGDASLQIDDVMSLTLRDVVP